MTKVLLTGCSGCGKTTAVRLLAENAITAYNTDDVIDATKLQNIATGDTIEIKN